MSEGFLVMSLEELRAATAEGRLTFDEYLAKCANDIPKMDRESFFDEVWQTVVKKAKRYGISKVRRVFREPYKPREKALSDFLSKLDRWAHKKTTQIPITCDNHADLKNRIAKMVFTAIYDEFQLVVKRFQEVGAKAWCDVDFWYPKLRYAMFQVKWKM